MVVFRADANGETGAGHIVRCAAIAKEVLRQGGEGLFVTADDHPRAFLEREGLDRIVLGTDYTRMEEEIAAFSAILKKVGADCVLVRQLSRYGGIPETTEGRGQGSRIWTTLARSFIPRI